MSNPNEVERLILAVQLEFDFLAPPPPPPEKTNNNNKQKKNNNNNNRSLPQGRMQDY